MESRGFKTRTSTRTCEKRQISPRTKLFSEVPSSNTGKWNAVIKATFRRGLYLMTWKSMIAPQRDLRTSSGNLLGVGIKSKTNQLVLTRVVHASMNYTDFMYRQG